MASDSTDDAQGHDYDNYWYHERGWRGMASRQQYGKGSQMKRWRSIQYDVKSTYSLCLVLQPCTVTHQLWRLDSAASSPSISPTVNHVRLSRLPLGHPASFPLK